VRVFEQISVFDNVMVVITQRSVWGALFERHKSEHAGRAKMVLERVGLWSKRDARAAELSYGQRKLLEIARALATGADLMVFDEPYAGLFPEMVKLVRGIMVELRDEGKTIVLVEHDMALIRELCDNLVVMDAGKLLAEGTAAEVLADRRVIEAYLGA
jgi:ABC-type branched-subunit amino acid transport system ATPase component